MMQWDWWNQCYYWLVLMGLVLLLTGFNGTSVTTDRLLTGFEWTSGPLTGAAAGFSVQSGPWLVPWWRSTSPQKCCSAAGMYSSVSWQNASFAKGSLSCDQHSNWFCIHGVICISTPHLDFDGQHWASEFIFSSPYFLPSMFFTLFDSLCPEVMVHSTINGWKLILPFEKLILIFPFLYTRWWPLWILDGKNPLEIVMVYRFI